MRGNRPEYKVCYQATEHSRAAHHERSVKWSSGKAEQQQQDVSALVNVKKTWGTEQRKPDRHTHIPQTRTCI